MTKSLKAAVLMALGLLVASGQGMRAQDQAKDALPKASELLAKSAAAMGGLEAYKAVKSVRARGTFEMAAQNFTGNVEIIQARPDKVRLTVTIPGLGSIENGCDGKICWSMDPMSGPSLLTGKALADALSEAQFDASFNGPDFVKEATTLEKTKFGDRPAYKLHVVSKLNSESTIYIDAETYYPIGMEKVSETPMGSMPTTTSAGQFKKFGLFMQPTVMVQNAMGFDQVIRMTSFEYDVVPASAWELPPAIKALIK
jgi:outer membrane lipoprotein-sorting protein